MNFHSLQLANELTFSLATLKLDSAVAEMSSRGDVLGLVTSTCLVST